MQEKCDLLVVYFAQESKSPVSLLELGLFANRGRGRIIVACPERFYRRGNVQVVCERFGIELVGSLEELAEAAGRRLRELGVEGVGTGDGGDEKIGA